MVDNHYFIYYFLSIDVKVLYKHTYAVMLKAGKGNHANTQLLSQTMIKVKVSTDKIKVLVLQIILLSCIPPKEIL